MTAISDIVSNLVTFSSKSITELELLNIDSILKEIIDLLKFSAMQKKIKLNFLAGTEQSRVRLNRNEFKQVILNVIKNSFEAMPEGGNINISTLLIKIGTAPFVRIVVSDTGPGIPDYQLKNIFLPFYSTKKGQESNLGLGLSISYSIVQKFQGTMSAYNNPEGGCSIIIELPAI
jgi:signal transduction histidine kinase